jgi:DNA invertase Pin-like site-specific DNA recombinase
MINRINAVYARQSIDKKESISIESQIESCTYELKGGNFKEYKDRGYSGKNTDRPDFQRLLRDIEAGLIAKVVVYKLDRISRSILDFAKMMESFQKYDVEFISSTEKFDTSTPMGRAMLNICIVFAQLERESIQQRVTDAWYSRCLKGFKMGGTTPYGFRTEPYVIQGIKTKRLIAEPTEAAFVKMMFELYVDPRLSLRDIIRAVSAQGMRARNGRILSRITLNAILRNPVYVIADLKVYEFFKSQGTEIINGAEDFTGHNACYYYQGKGTAEHKSRYLEGQTLVIAPHEGFIPSDLWIKVRKKLLANQHYQPARKAKNSWLAGKIKCGHCGFALMTVTASNIIYFRCTAHAEDKELCPGCGTVRLVKLHELVYGEMVKKLKGFKTIKGRARAEKANPKLTAKQISLARIDSEIDKLVESLVTAGATLVSYVNAKIEDLDAQRQKLTREIAALTLDTIPPAQMDAISNYLDDWGNVSFEDKQKVVDYLINRVRATSESVEIEWKI